MTSFSEYHSSIFIILSIEKVHLESLTAQLGAKVLKTSSGLFLNYMYLYMFCINLAYLWSINGIL